MSAEPQPDGRDKLDKALFGLKIVWFGLLSGAIVITVTLTAIVFSGTGPFVDLGDLSYLFLLAVPVGLVGALVIPPMTTPRDPADLVKRFRTQDGKPLHDDWEGTKPDDPYYWYPVFLAQFFIRVGILDGTAIICAMGFLLTGNWANLGGALVLIAALGVQGPTRSSVEAFADTNRPRLDG